MYKLVAIDLDGTLLDNNKEISDKNKEVLSQAIKKGVKIVICSGRIYAGARLYAKQVKTDAPVIACNGAIITENINGKVIYSNCLKLEDCLSINSICKKHGVYYHVYAGDTMFTEKLGFTSLKYYEKNKTLPPEDRVKIEVVKDMEYTLRTVDGEVSKFVIISDDAVALKAVRNEMEQLSEVDIMSSNFDNFEVMNKGVNKGAALKQLSEMLNINPEEMMAIGDNENDISMLEYAGLSVVMDNGEKIVKEIADYITTDNNKDGVAQAIEKFILK